jgi:hypothetical protein
MVERVPTGAGQRSVSKPRGETLGRGRSRQFDFTVPIEPGILFLKGCEISVVPIETTEVRSAVKLTQSVTESFDIAAAPGVPGCCSLGLNGPPKCLPSFAVGKKFCMTLSMCASYTSAVSGHRAGAFHPSLIRQNLFGLDTANSPRKLKATTINVRLMNDPFPSLCHRRDRSLQPQ